MSGLPEKESENVGHSRHEDILELPDDSRYVPDGQLRHVVFDDEPFTTEYFPATHPIQLTNASLPIVSRYVPDGQLRHVVTDDEPFTTEYLPATQLIQSTDASLPNVSRYVPGGQLEQVFSVKAPTSVEYVPVPQFVHTAVPVDVLYFPATQSAQGPPSGPLEPALQVQFVKAALPTGELELDGQAVHVELAAAFTAVEYVPVPQFVHAAVPVDVLYLPATQSAHVPPWGPLEPALQVQLVEAALPTGELESDGQAVHVAAFTAVEYVPVPQFVHSAVPVDVLYFPATQSAQGPPSGPLEPALQVQFVKAALPTGELELDGQAVHVELAAAFTAVEYVPVPQFVHAAVPVDVLYLPATQSAHVPPWGPLEPALQVQLVEAALPTGELESDGQAVHVAAFTAVEYVPVPQFVHSAVPVDVLYFPATQSAQGPPSGPVEPALQVQFVKAALLGGELEFDGQAVHVKLAEAPTAVEYVPPAQSEQAAAVVAPVTLPYLPAGQPAHVLAAVALLYLPAPHAVQVSVKSSPRTMRLVMAEAASVLMYSSTTKRPAMSPLK